MQDSVVEDIVPLTAAAQLNRPEDDEEEAPSISERIKVYGTVTFLGEQQSLYLIF